ncbi:MAG: hypothetical protein K6F89_07635 [Prevotella sp.]|nr:hypothetical protein [Prevotella sp.]
MNKKAYIIPATDVLAMCHTQMIAVSMLIDESLAGEDILIKENPLTPESIFGL